MRRGTTTTIILALLALLTAIPLQRARAEEPAPSNQENQMLENLHKMRMRAQAEEQHVVRLRQFAREETGPYKCTPVQQIRQRMREINTMQGKVDSNNVDITAGHDELNVTDNHGTINSNINIQIIEQGQNLQCL